MDIPELMIGPFKAIPIIYQSHVNARFGEVWKDLIWRDNALTRPTHQYH